MSQRIFMTGDSHVAGKIYPRTVGEILEQYSPEIQFDFWGKNGARFDTFNDDPSMMRRIYDADPDIIIVHLGTNDSYSSEFNERRFIKNLDEFYENIQDNLPGCKIIFVTPFFNKIRAKGGGKWQVNNNTRLCADALLDFAANHPDCYVADNNGDYGMTFIEQPGLIRDDNVHLSVEGYRILGEQVAEEILSLPDLLEENYEEDEWGGVH